MSDAIVAAARGWLGTPYLHQASLAGVGTDCLGLVRGVWRSIVGAEPLAVPVYTQDWGETDRQERLLEGAARCLARVSPEERLPGDVLVFRMRSGSVAKHVGILATAPEGHETLIHAYSGHGVVETALTDAWQRRLAAVFRFPQKV